MSELNFLKGRIIEKLRVAGIVSAEAEADRIVNAATDEIKAMQLVVQHISGAPLSLLLGVQEFFGLDFFVGVGALVPRQETELLASVAIDFLSKKECRELKIIDMCCGVGNLACVLAKHFPQAHIWASDLTEACVSLTRRNVEHLGLTNRSRFVRGIYLPLWWGGLKERWTQWFAILPISLPANLTRKRLSSWNTNREKHSMEGLMD
jgi:HemK-like putative methylase